MSFKSPEKIKKLFNDIADMYDFANNFISLGLQKYLKKKLVTKLNLSDEEDVLDICTGTGDIARLLSLNNSKISVKAVDFSEKMLEIAENKNKASNIEYILADATDLPFQNSKFDKITMFFGLRNIENIEQALSEIHRVLKSGGLFLQLDFGKTNFFVDLVFNLIVNLFISVIGKNKYAYKYLLKSKKDFLSPDELITKLSELDFMLECRKDFLFGIISAQFYKKM